MPKRTLQRHKSRLRKTGFRARMATKNGKKVLKRRRDKKRSSLSASTKMLRDKNKRLTRRR